MVKWIALFLALGVVWRAPDKDEVSGEISKLQARVKLLEARSCTLMQVVTPTGNATICAIQ